MVNELHRAHMLHAKLRGCTIERLCDALSIIRDSLQTNNSDDEDDSSPTSHLGIERESAREAIPVLPSLTETKMYINAAFQQSVQVRIVRIGSIHSNLQRANCRRAVTLLKYLAGRKK
jgi:hypothetical protein